MLKCASEEMVSEVTRFFNLVINEKRVPEEWKKAKPVPIFKIKGSKLECNNSKKN